MASQTNLKFLAALLFCVDDSVAAAQQREERPDKRNYTLFNPTPEAYLRELSADRPDKTESPFTVDAGHFQLEMDVVNLTYNSPNDERPNTRSTSVEIAPMNLKVGLLNDLDFQLVFTPYNWERTDVGGDVEHKSGFDGITPRLKLNVVGNDGGPFALALLPFVRLPLSQDDLGNNSVEGGVAIPLAFDVAGWEVALQTAFEFNRDDTGDAYHLEVDNSISVGHSLFGRLSGYVEFFGGVSTEGGAGWVGTVDTWLTYDVNRNFRLDAGVYIGVTDAADDWHPWIGLTWRH